MKPKPKQPGRKGASRGKRRFRIVDPCALAISLAVAGLMGTTKNMIAEPLSHKERS